MFQLTCKTFKFCEKVTKCRLTLKNDSEPFSSIYDADFMFKVTYRDIQYTIVLK